MKRLKKLIAPLAVLIIVVVGVIVIVGWKDEETLETIRTKRNENVEDQYILENDQLKLVMDGKTTQFSVKIKENGDVWYSNPTDAAKDQKAVTLEKENLQSTLLLKYSTINGVDTQYNNYGYSIENGLYEIESGDGYIKVNYSIGNVEKEYVIPKVIREGRMNELLENMDKNGQSRVTNYYKRYDINNLGKKDDRDQLIADYPIILEDVIYVLRDNAKDTMKGSMEGIFAEAGYTMEEFIEGKSLYHSEVVSDKPIFNISMIYRLEGSNLVVEVPFSDIEYRKQYPVVSVNVLPYFGAGGTEENGYLMVPEGGGGLINFNNGKTAQASYYADLYGWDMALSRKSVVHETSTYFNAFGIAKETSAFLCILDEGASYASIQADISGKSNSYNYASASYTVLHRDQYDVTERYNGAMYVYEPKLPEESLVQKYCFQTSNSYTEMAEHYREYLMERFDGELQEQPKDNAPLIVEMIGAIDKVKQVFGVPVSKPFELTTYEEALSMIDELKANGIDELSVKYSGFMNGGVQQKVLNKVKLLNSVGNKKELKNFVQSAKERDVDVYLNGITNYASNSNIFNGFYGLRDAARMVTKERVKLYPYSAITYAQLDDMKPYYLLHADNIITMMDHLSDAATKYGANVSFQDVGAVLSADYYRKHPVSREAAMQMQVEKLKEIKDGGSKVLLNTGNDYAIPYSDVVVDMNLSGYAYTILDANVPIYQMAVHDYVTYTGAPINLAPNMEEEILTSAEYGAGLSCTLMGESSVMLQETDYTRYYGADYSTFKDRLIEIYSRYNKELGCTFSQKMTGHRQITDTVSCTEYEDGTKVYVNYSYDDFVTEDGTTVAARDYSVVR